MLSNRLPMSLALALLAALTTAVYWGGFGGGFVFDDFHNIVNNPSLRMESLDWREWMQAAFSSESGPLRRPISMFSFAVNTYFTDLDPRPMKMTNLAIHLANTLLVFGLTLQLFRAATARGVPEAAPGADTLAAFLAAAVWCLHPINLMGVLYVVQRMESLCHLFVFGGLWLYVAGRSRMLDGRSGLAMVLAGMVGGTALAVLCKESGVLLPVYALCIELCLFRFQAAKRSGLSRPMLVLFVVVLVLPACVAAIDYLPRYFTPRAYRARDFGVTDRLLTESRIVLEYLKWILAPNLRDLSLYHDEYRISRTLLDPAVLAALATIAALLALAWASVKRRPMVALGILLYFSGHLLTATIVPLELIFEHRNYFPAFGVCLVLADVLVRWPQTPPIRRTGILLASGFVLLCAGLTHLRALEWNHPVRFAYSEAAKNPESPRAAYELGRALVILTEYRRDSPHVQEAFAALERASKMPGSTVLPEHAILLLAARTGLPQPRSAWAGLQSKLRTQTMSASNIVSLIALTDCAVKKECAFERQDMLDTLWTAVARSPEPGILSIYGKYVLYELHDAPLALELWTAAAKAKPGNPTFASNLIALEIAMGRFEDAERRIQGLRTLGRFGENEAAAASLSADLAAARLRQRAHQGP